MCKTYREAGRVGDRMKQTAPHEVRKDLEMAFSLACRDAGVDCSHVVEGETIDGVLAEGGIHAKDVHGYTDEQLADPALGAQLRSLIKET